MYFEEQRKKRTTTGYVLFMGIAAVLHLLLFLIPTKWLFPPTKSSKKKVLRVRYVPRSKRSVQVKNNRRRKQRITRKKKKDKQKKKEKIDGQFVDVPPSQDNRKPEKTKYLSQHNNRVKKQTVSKHRRLKYKVAMRELTRNKKKVVFKKKPKLASKKITIKDRRKLKKGKSKQKKKKKTIAKRGLRGKSPNVRLPSLKKKKVVQQQADKGSYKQKTKSLFDVRSLSKRLKLKVGMLSLKKRTGKDNQGVKQGVKQGTAMKKLPDVYDLLQSVGKYSRVQGAPAPDHLKDLPESDQTQLNTRFHRYATFFNRVKKMVAQHWSPGRSYRRRDPYGNVYGTIDRHTVLHVVLNKSGKLTDISVKKTSGITFLDKEAMRAFRLANSFPNPPSELSGKDGKIRFSFGFFLEISKRPKFLFFR